jgi:hypothetical protein
MESMILEDSVALSEHNGGYYKLPHLGFDHIW